MSFTLRLIHRITGLIGSLLVILMAVTGLLLNHRSLIGYNVETKMKLQQFIFNLHTGTVGSVSILWLTDLGAICMLVLSMTGIWMWFKRRR
ncbi:PepSY domain-containing protein [Aneurinibacillus tyrosinisolvens]|uniref:PepSY domain-containing protein n=1 Tax=Aneurinibacillus tyrosinisolvens TaxID=1443435 RepID=UPI00063F8CA9|nr:PepSY domain-containing protein [Aneurinibacillus tyrosinisolvens]